MLNRIFKLKQNNTSVSTEVMAGITTFMTMAYILAVNPDILSATGMDKGALFTATALAAFIATLAMAFIANLPFALAPGMGLNAFFAYTVVLGMGYSWQVALAAVFLEGIIFLLLTLFNIREIIAVITIDNLNKIGFGVLAIAALMNILKKQRDAVGLSVFSDTYNFYFPEKGSERHHQMLLSKLSEISLDTKPAKQTEIYTYLHLIAEKLKRRSLIFLFTDMFQTATDDDKIFDALRHLKYNKHEVVLFHLLDMDKEFHFGFENTPKRFLDVETGEHIDLFSENIKENYEQAIKTYFDALKMKCAQYKIKYVDVDVRGNFSKVLNTFMVERQKFL